MSSQLETAPAQLMQPSKSEQKPFSNNGISQVLLIHRYVLCLVFLGLTNKMQPCQSSVQARLS